MLTALVATAITSTAFAPSSIPSLIVSQTQRKQTQGAGYGVWARRDIEGTRMTAVIPDSTAKFDPSKIGDTPETVINAIWRSIKVEDIYIIFNLSTFKKGVKVDLKGASKAGISKLEEVGGVSEIRVQSRNLTLNGIPAIRLRADYKFQNERMVYWLLVAGKGDRMWQVTTTGYADPANLKAVLRVFDSVVIKP